MTEKPFFSIITVTLNNLGGLKKTAPTVIGQDFTDYEWRVFDGASTDGSREFLQTQGIPFTSEPDRGLYDAMNKGLDWARGEYVLFLNAGDELPAPDALFEVSRHIRAEDKEPDFVYGDFLREINGSMVLHRARHHTKIALGAIASQQAMFYRREALGDMRHDLRYKIAADYHLTCWLLQKTQDVLYCPFALSIAESGGISQQNAALARIENSRVRHALGICGPLKNGLILGFNLGGMALKKLAPGFYARARNVEAGLTPHADLPAPEQIPGG